jgi:carboxyl-terminal processing protease
MHKTKFFPRGFCALAVFSFLTACSGDRWTNAEISGVFLRHSWKAWDKNEVDSLLKRYGPQGLKKLDPFCGVYYPAQKHAHPPFVESASHAGFIAESDGAELLVDKVFDNSPADVSGIKEGDRIVKINGKPPSLYDAAKLNGFFESAGGWNIDIELSRKGVDAPLKMKLERKSPRQPVIWGFYREKNKTLYVRINSFSKGAASAVEKTLSSFNSRKTDRLLVDLRHNSTGLLDELRAVLELFSPKSALLFSTQSRVEGYRGVFTSRREPLRLPARIFVIIDGATSGVSEIFALSARRNAAAVIVGEKSEGMLSIFKTFRISKNMGFTMTVAMLAGPDGLAAAGIGVKPDIEADRPQSAALPDFPPSQILNADPAFMKAVGN